MYFGPQLEVFNGPDRSGSYQMLNGPGRVKTRLDTTQFDPFFKSLQNSFFYYTLWPIGSIQLFI